MEAAKGQDDPVVPKWALFFSFSIRFASTVSMKSGLRLSLP